ncbi:MAG: hypothetical protein MUE70_07485, partial [Desulfobacterales bacterium]|nr:hypothetical protein [Desulfobacterales bacterium]
MQKKYIGLAGQTNKADAVADGKSFIRCLDKIHCVYTLLKRYVKSYTAIDKIGIIAVKAGGLQEIVRLITQRKGIIDGR